MPPELVALLLSAAVATVVTLILMRSAHAGPQTWVRRLTLPLLWVASRDFRSTFTEFSRRTVSNREIGLVLWLCLFLLALLVFELILRGAAAR
jgi:hypothetical protein